MPDGWPNHASLPVHHKKDAMMHDDDTGHLLIPPPKVKEQLHEIPADYMAVGRLDDRTRHRLIGNGWHWGVASRLLAIHHAGG